MVEDQMDGACSMHGTEGNSYRTVSLNHMRDLGVEDPEETERNIEDWIDLALVNTVMNFGAQ
jgi:hypothetical protein